MVAGEVVFRAKDVSLRLGGNLILENVSFEIKDRVRPDKVTGQIVALLGPSGVGKTQLLKIIAGLNPPDKGAVTGLHDKPIEAGTVGVVFQNYLLLRHRTVMGNLVTAGVMNGMKRDEARTAGAALLKRFGLGERADFYPAQLSGGQRQRVAIAQQLVKQKVLLLMDEPFSGLDPSALDEVIKLLVQVRDMDELNTIVIVTHDIRAALAVADTVLMLGRERTSDGNVISGAHIKQTYDLVDLGLAYRDGISDTTPFHELETKIKDQFKAL
jgi:polar amino acid transport system ATP-binding protein/sulfate transport system ATP-binding protein